MDVYVFKMEEYLPYITKHASFFHEEGKLRDSLDAGEITEEVFLSGRKEILEPILGRIHDFCLENVDRAIGKLKAALQYSLDRSVGYCS